MIMFNKPDPRFVPGQLVRHSRYGYRGVVVGLDGSCQAPDEWYQSNRTQPNKQQPWYHVLVDGARHATYAAEDSLIADDSDAPISHPLLETFFDGFEDGLYQRNDQEWQGW